MHEQWSGFFVAETGAAAALTGLFFVAISINIERIVRDAILPGRAVETLAMLTGALIMASLMLVPEQDDPWLGVELGVVALATWGMIVGVQLRSREHLDAQSGRTFPERVLVGQLATVPAIAAASFFAAGSSVGFAVLAVSILVCFVASITNAWVLLVEILR